MQGVIPHDITRVIATVIHSTMVADPQWRWESARLHCDHIRRHKLWSGTRGIIVMDTIESRDSWTCNMHYYLESIKITTYGFAKDAAVLDMMSKVDYFVPMIVNNCVSAEILREISGVFARQFLNTREPKLVKSR